MSNELTEFRFRQESTKPLFINELIKAIFKDTLFHPNDFIELELFCNSINLISLSTLNTWKTYYLLKQLQQNK